MNDYQIIAQQAKHEKELSKSDRFAKISEREDKSALPDSVWQPLLANSYLQSWNGIALNKGVTEIGIYPMLLSELQPKTIIEIGAFTGGSAIWLTDCLEIFKIEGTVYSVDIDLSMLDEKAKSDSRVNFVKGDGNNLGEVLPAEKLSQLPHPWLIIQDTAMVDVTGLLEYFHNNGLKSGDYLIIEDTNKWVWDSWGGGWENQEEMENGRQKMAKLRNWLMNHEDEYLVDTYYLDIYGYNGSKNWNSVLKKV
ncbi:O-methyltransferase [Calothrix rhizosoleniae]|uniref:O-methyltransferase n=1 Tax=Calothrix rhizosoleniae TaxID=888997 RepID=UPI000B49920D|nr:CmcI family methyltransferase [Calothrix rhizosoleniae]